MLALMVASGWYKVERVAGLLPPWGVTKRIEGDKGCTYLFGVPIGRFHIDDSRFVYERWPIVDVLDPEEEPPRAPTSTPDGAPTAAPTPRTGSGTLGGHLSFCRFRLVPA